MSESGLWKQIQPLLQPLDGIRIEDSLGLGIPDVNYMEGWIELKWVDDWPVRDTTILRVPHFTAEQRTWLTRRCESGGRAHVLLSVGGDKMLFWGLTACQVVGHLNRDRLEKWAIKTWPKRSKTFKKEFMQFLLKDIPKSKIKRPSYNDVWE